MKKQILFQALQESSMTHLGNRKSVRMPPQMRITHNEQHGEAITTLHALLDKIAQSEINDILSRQRPQQGKLL